MIMDKKKFFTQLHTDLAAKYNLTTDIVQAIRSFSGKKFNRKEIAEWAAVKLSQPRKQKGQSYTGKRRQGREHYQKLLNFVASCSDDSWKDLTQRTEFDNHGVKREGTALPEAMPSEN